MRGKLRNDSALRHPPCGPWSVARRRQAIVQPCPSEMVEIIQQGNLDADYFYIVQEGVALPCTIPVYFTGFWFGLALSL